MITRIVTFALIAVTLAVAAHESGGDPLAAEIARLEGLLTAAETAALSDDVKGQIAPLREALARARRAKEPSYALYRLRDPFVGIEALAFMTRNGEASQSLEAFERLWSAHAINHKLEESAPQGTLVQRALIESAGTRSDRLFEASLPYAKADSPASGVYYLGESEGNRKFGAFIRQLGGASTEKSPGRDHVAAALDSLERETLAIFGTDVTNQKLIAVSVRLKEARELLAAGRVNGAALLAVEAKVALLRRGGVAGKHPAPRGTTPESLGALIGAWADDEEAPMNQTLRTDVAPFFRSLYATAPAAAKHVAQVKVTLVRWPYT